MVAWTLTSFAFGVFLANFGVYDKTYGTLAAIITFLIWAWLTNIAILVGIERDSEIERVGVAARRGRSHTASASPRVTGHRGLGEVSRDRPGSGSVAGRGGEPQRW